MAYRQGQEICVQSNKSSFVPQSPRESNVDSKSSKQVGQFCGLTLSCHVLLHTLLTNLVRNGNDLMLVAEIGGHKRLETTGRYTLPSASDKEKAMEQV